MKYADFVKIGPTLPDGAFSEYDMEAIYPALKNMKKDDIYVEIGVMHGRSLAWARMISKGWVYGIDRNNELDVEWFIDKNRWSFIHKSSNEAVKSWTLPIDVLFIDGGHEYEEVKDDWDNFSPFVKKGGVVYFHDCDATSPGVVKLFEELKGKKTLWTDKMQGRKTSMASIVI